MGQEEMNADESENKTELNPSKMSDEELKNRIDTYYDNTYQFSMWKDLDYFILISEKNSRESAKINNSMLEMTRNIQILTKVMLGATIVNIFVALI